MSNWGTMKSELLRMVKADSTSSGSVVDSDASRSIIGSIVHNRSHYLGWNTASYAIAVVDGEQRYNLPRDYLGLVSPVWWSNVATNASNAGRREMISRPLAWVESNTFRIPGQSEYRYLGNSMAYAIDPANKQIVLSPVPGSTDSQIDFFYLLDPGTPGMSASSGTWTFTKPWSEDAISDSFTNAWFEVGKGYELVLARAVYLMWAKIWGGTEESAAFQENALRMWGEELARLRREASKTASNTGIRPRI